jgi:hypothetical protein
LNSDKPKEDKNLTKRKIITKSDSVKRKNILKVKYITQEGRARIFQKIKNKTDYFLKMIECV